MKYVIVVQLLLAIVLHFSVCSWDVRPRTSRAPLITVQQLWDPPELAAMFDANNKMIDKRQRVHLSQVDGEFMDATREMIYANKQLYENGAKTFGLYASTGRDVSIVVGLILPTIMMASSAVCAAISRRRSA